MCKEKLVLVFVLLTLLGGVGLGTVGASPAGPEVVPGLNGPVSEWADADLEKLVDLIFDEQITVPQVRAFYELLTDEQRKTVSGLVAVKAGIPPDEWQRSIESHETQTVTPLFPGEIWRQPIENAWVFGGYPPGSTFARYYWPSVLCDGDPSDLDWVFYFGMDYSQNPDGLRWTSNSSQVYLIFLIAYGGNLNGYAMNWSEAKLCIGDTSVQAIGGPEIVQARVFLHPNNNN